MDVWIMLVTMMLAPDNVSFFQLEFESRQSCERTGQLYVSLYKDWFYRLDALCSKK